jgi:hypothetical protein
MSIAWGEAIGAFAALILVVGMRVNAIHKLPTPTAELSQIDIRSRVHQ